MFRALNYVIQTGFGWLSYHLYSIVISEVGLQQSMCMCMGVRICAVHLGSQNYASFLKLGSLAIFFFLRSSLYKGNHLFFVSLAQFVCGVD